MVDDPKADKPKPAEKKTKGSAGVAGERPNTGVVFLDPLTYGVTSVRQSTVSDLLTRVNSLTVTPGLSAIADAARWAPTDYSTIGSLVVDPLLTSKHRELESEITPLE
jgi:hypothetical protein